MNPEIPKFDELQNAARRGDRHALATLFESYRPRLERMIRVRLDTRLLRRVDPADVLQETFLEVQQKFEQYLTTSELPLFLWFRLETGQKLLKLHRFHLRAQVRSVDQEVSLHRGGAPSVTSLSLADRIVDRVSTASRIASKDELRAQVQEALNQMNEVDREILVLRHFEEMSNSETAMILGISSTAAANRHVRALERIRRVLEGSPNGMEGFE